MTCVGRHVRHSAVSQKVFAVVAPIILAVVSGIGCSGSGKATGSDGSAASGGAIGNGGSISSGGTSGASGATGTGAGGPGESMLTLPGESVLMHHKNPSRDGVYVEPTLTKAAISGFKRDANFNPVLTNAGEIYAQPLFVDGGAGGTDLVIVATESNNIYALNAVTGAQVWMVNLGTPLPLAQAMCGNLDLYGITGTPAIDFDSRTLFADAVVIPSG
jgi:outer membrane protein assembly factor BamB